MRNSNVQHLTCNASTCTGSLSQAGSGPAVVSCANGSQCNLQLCNDSVGIKCQSNLSCVLHASQGNFVMDCNSGASCDFASCSNASRNIACAGDAASCSCAGTTCALDSICSCP